ncbi:hypothetical protein [Exiguobacterium sp. R-17]|uniref:hypothetical protein n=1 Tax=Exiguobacterium sp. R-17 TaxID=3404054 RepID=UPI003CEF4E51
MRKLIIFHKKNYKPKLAKKRMLTKEFGISVFWILAFVASFLSLPLLADSISVKYLWIIPIVSFLGTYIYFTHLERDTEFFVNDDSVYKEKLKKFLFGINIVNSAQLDIVIKNIVEEREGSRKQLGITLPYILAGVTLSTIILNKVQISNKDFILYFIDYLVVVFFIHIVLKVCEPFFNLYADNVSTLINFLKQIQIEWLDDRPVEALSKNDQYEAIENFAENEPKELPVSVEIDHVIVDNPETRATKSNPLN